MEKRTLLRLYFQWKNRIQKAAVFLVAAVLLVVMSGGSAFAAGIDVSRNGTLTIETVHDGQQLKGMAYQVYRVADVSTDGVYTLVGVFGSCGETVNDFKATSQWRAAAVRMAEWAKDHGAAGTGVTTGDDGKASLAELQTGLYLVDGSSVTNGTATYTSEAFLVRLPSQKTDGTLLYEVTVSPKTEVTDNPDKPSEPETKPSEPETKPSEPETKPSEPETKPSQPETRPSRDHDHENHRDSSNSNWNSNQVQQSTSADQAQTVETTAAQSDQIQNTEKLPQTGQLKWPVPCLLIAGILILIADRILSGRRKEAGRNYGMFLVGMLSLCGALGLQGYNLMEEKRAEAYSEAVLPELEQVIAEIAGETGAGADAAMDGTTPEMQKTGVQDGVIQNYGAQTDRISQAAVNFTTDGEEPVVIVDGTAYLGYLEIPEWGLTLPVRENLSYPGLRESPCRYSGSVNNGGLVIAAHNYKRHFSKIGSLKPEDKISFTDGAGNVHQYQVVGSEVLEPEQVEEMKSDQWDLTLFTCTYGGSRRIVVRCIQV